MARRAGASSDKPLTKWRGKSATSTAAAKHDWHADRARLHGRPARRRTFWRWVRVACLLLFGGGGGAALLTILLHREVQVPFVAVVKTTFRHALPPNAWAFEDIESLRSGSDALDNKTIDVVDLSDADYTSESLLVPASDARRKLTGQARQTGVIVFYVSLHGLVDDAGQACVATPDAAPCDAATWLPVSRLLRQIRNWELPNHVHKLLIFDCNRQQSNWNVGLIENTFASRLQHALEETPVPNLVIMNSTSPGEIGWASPEMRGSVFGQFLRLGLAGAADLPQEGGNYDRRVSLNELHSYLLRRVDGWTQENRGVRQRPLLIPADPPNFLLTWSLDRPLLDRVVSEFIGASPADPTVSRSQIDELWSAFATLRDGQADSWAPLEMSDLRQRLVWLEQAAQAGAAYRLEAISAEREWKRLAERLRERLSRPVAEVLAPQGAAAYADIWVPGLAARLRSLPLLARMGRAEPAVIEGLLGQLRQLEAEASLENLDAILSSPSTKDLAGSVGVVHFLKLLRRSQQSRGIPDSAPASLAQVLELQTLSASAPVPSDPRTQEWIRVVTDAADVARRRADDALLAGQADPVSADSAAHGYREGLAIANAVYEALALTDLAAAELPDLARWLTSSSSDRDAVSPTRAPKPADTVNQLLNLVNAAHLLVNNLHAPRGADAAADLSILPQYRSFRSQYEGLRQRFDDACERLVTSTESSPHRALQAAAILDLPLLSTRTTENGLNPLEQRRKIQTLYSQISRELHRLSMEHAAKPGGSGGKTGALGGDEAGDLTPVKSAEQSRVGDLVIALIEPLGSAVGAEMKSSGLTATAETAAAAKAGARVRRALQAVPAEIEAARERHLASADQPRLEWSRAARLARCTAPFITSPWPIDPVAELRRGDIQQILLWHAGRYLDDFWGPCLIGEPCYFDSATTDAIDAARLIINPNPAVEKQIAGLKALLALRQKASRMGLVVRADALLLVDLADQPAAHVAVSRNPAVADDGLPAGLAMLRIDDQSGDLLGPVVDFPIQGPSQEPSQAPGQIPDTAGDSRPQELKLPLGSARHVLTDTVGAATAFFRGHEFRDDLVIKTAAGTTVEARPRSIRNARIRLNGNKRQRASVVFVLDCSASMRKGMPFESTNAIVPRMEVAKAALVRMMTALAARGDARVGVLLYGHRVGWSTKEPNQLLTQATWGGALPEGLKPYEDVETILPLGRFDSIAAAKVAQRLEKVKPWGETPLYLSLTQALLEFKDDDPDAQQSVVVITDGVNYQFNPRSEMAKTAQDVLTADAVRRIPLHIVGFGIEANETQQAQREFSRLASETGGQYVSVSEAAALADTLEDILQRRPYSVASPLGRTLKAPIGTAIDLAWELDDPQDYTVTVDALSEPVEVTGGEAVELFISQDGQSLISAAYDAGAPRFADLVGGSPRDPQGVRLGVHQPLREGTTVTFDLSLQHAQQRFVRRPREVWIEITPIMGDNRPAPSRKYVIYDPEFVPQTPVPVLRAVAHSWPKEARRSRIDFWCKWTATDPSLVIPCSQLADPGRGDPLGATLDGIPGMKYQVRERPGTPLRIDFIETYAADVSGETMVKVDITGPVAPSRILHQFDSANHFATHSFLFDNARDSGLVSAASIRVISRRRMLDDACHVEVPVLIEVPSQSDTLPAAP